MREVTMDTKNTKMSNKASGWWGLLDVILLTGKEKRELIYLL
jgi:hypothetical protein